MGPPADRMTVGQTEVWSYQSGNGQTVGSVFASGGSGFASGFGVTEQRFCKVNIVMTKGEVSEVNYSGPTGGLLTQGEQCAFARSKSAYSLRLAKQAAPTRRFHGPGQQ